MSLISTEEYVSTSLWFGDDILLFDIPFNMNNYYYEKD